MDPSLVWSILSALLGGVFSAGGTWAVMRSQVSDLRETVREKASLLDGVNNRVTGLEALDLKRHGDRITRLESDVASHKDQLDRVVDELRSVVEDLREISVRLAGKA